MKNLFLLFALFTSGLLSETTFAQVSFKLNITSQPIWGPVGYDHVEYYYLPDIDAYYYVPRHKYIYKENNNWVSRTYLPTRYKDYDMYNSRKVVINDSKPYLRHQEYKEKYALASEHSNQQSIRDSHEGRYFENKNHPEHSKWREYKRNQEREHERNRDHENKRD